MEDEQHNGYRLDLYNLLRAAGINVKFLGSQSSGSDNPQPQHEGYGWNTINQIQQHMEEQDIMSLQPKLVLIHAGTNDNDMQSDTEKYVDAHIRLGKLVDYVIDRDPSVVVLVARLIQNNYNQTQTDHFNSRVPDIVDGRLAKGHKVRMVDMSMIGGSELSDLLHPTRSGYTDMASRWFSAIMEIPDDWW